MNLENPPGISSSIQHSTIQAINDLNRMRLETAGGTELASRMNAYELAFRMQSAAPELVDLSGETKETLDAYGVDRKEPPIKSNRGGIGLFGTFARNCLLARRLVERGVRVVNLIHASWDHHSNLDPEIEHNSLMVDQPIAALLRDLKERGLLDETLVIWGSEFGRTPLGENRSGFAQVTGAIITRTRSPSGWRAAESKRGTSTGRLTTSAGTSLLIPSTSTTSMRPFCICSAWITRDSPTSSRAATSASPTSQGMSSRTYWPSALSVVN